MPLDNRFAVPIAEGLLIESGTKHRRIHGVHGHGLKGISPLIERTLHTRLSTDSIVKTHTDRRDSPHALHGSIVRGQSASRRKALSALFCRATTGRTPYVALHRETPAVDAAHLDWSSLGGLPAHARCPWGCCLAHPWRGPGWRHQSAGTGEVTGTAWTEPAVVCAVSRLALGGGASELWHIPLDRCIGHAGNHDPSTALVGSRYCCHHRLDHHCHSLRHCSGHPARYLDRLCRARR